MKQSLIEKLKRIGYRYRDISALLSDPDVMNNQNQYRELTKEYAQLEPVVLAYRAHQDNAAALDSAESMLEELKAIKTPTLLMRGGISNVLALDAAERVAETMSDCRLVEIPGAGHRVQGDNPKDFTKELDGFLSATLA